LTSCVPSKTVIEAAAQKVPFVGALRRMRQVIEEIAAPEDARSRAREGYRRDRGWGGSRRPRTAVGERYGGSVKTDPHRRVLTTCGVQRLTDVNFESGVMHAKSRRGDQRGGRVLSTPSNPGGWLSRPWLSGWAKRSTP
jgi:hypothetical protein